MSAGIRLHHKQFKQSAPIKKKRRLAFALLLGYLVLSSWLLFVPDSYAQGANAAGQTLASAGSSDPEGPNSVAPGATSSAQNTSPTSPYENTTTDDGATQKTVESDITRAGNNVDRMLSGGPYVTTLAQQAGEQGIDGTITRFDGIMGDDGWGVQNDVYRGLKKWYSEDVVSRLFRSIGQLMSKWMTEFINGWICPAVQFLSTVLQTFIMNTNVALGKDDISVGVRKVADTMYSIATDLLLLWFILCTWKYWAEAQWRGMVNILSPVLRMITTAGILLAWPTLYTFVVQIANEMIQALWFNSPDQTAQLGTAIADSIRLGLIAGLAGLVKGIAPALGPLMAATPGVGAFGVFGAQVITFMAGLIFTFLGGIIIVELIALILLKAIQTILLLAQYMFAPIFIVMFAAPDTEMYTVKFMYGFVAVNLWSFFWLGCLRILVIVMNSNYEPWGKILIAIGALTLMIYAPAFQMSGVIEPTSPFLNPKDWVNTVGSGFDIINGAISNGLKVPTPDMDSQNSTMSANGKNINGLGGNPPAGAVAANPNGANPNGANPAGAQLNANGPNPANPNAPNALNANQNGQNLNPANAQQAAALAGAGALAGAAAAGQQGAGLNAPGAPGAQAGAAGAGVQQNPNLQNVPPPGPNANPQAPPPQGPNANPQVPPPQGPNAAVNGVFAAPPKAPPRQNPWGPSGPFAGDNDNKSKLNSNARAIDENANNAETQWAHMGGVGTQFTGSEDGNSVGIIVGDYDNPGTTDSAIDERNLGGMASYTTDEANRAGLASAKAYGFGKPQTEHEKAYAAQLSMQGQRFEESAYGRAKLQRNVWKAKLLDSQAYMAGRSGNGYDKFLTKELGGSYSPQQMAATRALIGNPIDSSSPENAQYAATKDHMGKAGVRMTTANANIWNNDSFIRGVRKEDKAFVCGEAGALVTKEFDDTYGPNVDADVRQAGIASLAHSKDGTFFQQILDMHSVAPQSAKVVTSVQGQIIEQRIQQAAQQQYPNLAPSQARAQVAGQEYQIVTPTERVQIQRQTIQHISTIANNWGTPNTNQQGNIVQGLATRMPERITVANAWGVVQGLHNAGIHQLPAPGAAAQPAAQFHQPLAQWVNLPGNRHLFT